MKITIAGDFCITSSFLSSNLFDQDIIDLFENSDFNIVNLECPITLDDASNKIFKAGPHLRTGIEIFECLKRLNVHAITLANNHILDYGENGLEDTIKGCIQNNIMHVGAGINSAEASKSLIIEKEGWKIAFVNFCENEWSIATPQSGGANPLDFIENLSQIKKTKQIADFVIVIVHGGHEYYHLPSPRMVKQYRFYAENGADAVIGHHTHCISGYEVYQNVPIAYSLGNMLFTKNNNDKAWYTGLIAQLQVVNNKLLQLELFPVRQSTQTFKLSKLEGIEKETVLKQLSQYNVSIENPSDLEKEWNIFIQNKYKNVNIFSPVDTIYGKYVGAVLKRLGLNQLLMKQRYLTLIFHHIRCEAHRDVLLEVLKRKISKK